MVYNAENTIVIKFSRQNNKYNGKDRADRVEMFRFIHKDIQ